MNIFGRTIGVLVLVFAAANLAATTLTAAPLSAPRTVFETPLWWIMEKPAPEYDEPYLGNEWHAVYAISKLDGKYVEISHEFDISGLDEIGWLKPGLLAFQAYSGGNSVGSRYLFLIAADGGTLTPWGSCSGYDDIDGDGINELYNLECVPSAGAHAEWEYRRVEIDGPGM